MACLSRNPIDVQRLVASVVTDERGGVATFVGLVRNHQDGRQVERLEYHAYEPMAEAECARILTEARSRWPVDAGLEHRLGALAIGDVAVAVAATGDHRAESFEACRWIVEQVKHRVPIWKKEFYADGTVGWVDPTRLAEALVPDPLGHAPHE
ncbi:MAG TPA: molybdenum cofactor biosynthesis protein MoaE [Gemmatimonadales bacterium]|nr:molybdenum cofactor biosynthesis protein MoaE [Gemmatimonadales bacterium]